jgi:hypothetical protein
MFHGARHIASSQGYCSMVHGDKARQTPKGLFIHENGSLTNILDEPAFGILQSPLNTLKLTVLE